MSNMVRPFQLASLDARWICPLCGLEVFQVSRAALLPSVHEMV